MAWCGAEHPDYCSGPVNWDASKLLTQKKQVSGVGTPHADTKSFWDNIDNFSSFLNFFDKYCTGNKFLLYGT